MRAPYNVLVLPHCSRENEDFYCIFQRRVYTPMWRSATSEALCVFAYLNLGCGALVHITFWQARSDWWCVAQNVSHFPKCFIGFRAIYRLSEKRYSYQSTEYKNRNKKCPASQDTAYIKHLLSRSAVRY